jgi:hypothetical protein
MKLEAMIWAPPEKRRAKKRKPARRKKTRRKI